METNKRNFLKTVNLFFKKEQIEKTVRFWNVLSLESGPPSGLKKKERKKSIFFWILFEMEFAQELRRLRIIRRCSHALYDSIALAS